MPRMQVYLPEDLYAEIKRRSLPASELLQEAVRAEVLRQDRLVALEEYFHELVDEFGEPDPEDIAWAEEVMGSTGRQPTGRSESAPKPAPKSAAEPAPESARGSAPKPAPKSAPGLASESAGEPAGRRAPRRKAAPSKPARPKAAVSKRAAKAS